VFDQHLATDQEQRLFTSWTQTYSATNLAQSEDRTENEIAEHVSGTAVTVNGLATVPITSSDGVALGISRLQE
jgi:hypothetical protein